MTRLLATLTAWLHPKPQPTPISPRRLNQAVRPDWADREACREWLGRK